MRFFHFRIIALGLLFPLLMIFPSSAQEAADIPKLFLPASHQHRVLPEEVDNSVSPWFPPIYSQIWFPNCQQASGVYHTLTYALNRVRHDTVKSDEQIMATNFTYNFYDGESQDGVSFLHSYQLIKEAGNPTRADFGNDHVVTGLYWMSGYDKYVRAMNNTIDEIYSIPLNTLEGLNTMRNWLFDHLDGSEWGGLAVFGAHPPYTNEILPPESPHAGFLVMPRIVSSPSHGMTIAGYSDSVRYDINNDGQFTNNLDINGDGRIDLGDWEIGGYLVVNSYGEGWGTGGKFYMMYSAFAQGIENWGAPNECAYVIKVKENYTPLMTAKFLISHNMRNRLSLKAGIATDTSRAYPEVIKDFLIFNYLGRAHSLSGNDTIENGDQLEAALDLTPLLSYVEPDKPFKVFLIADQRDIDDGQAHGTIHGFSVIAGGKEFVSPVSDLVIDGIKRSIVPVMLSGVSTNQPVITNPNLVQFSAGEVYSQQLTAAGGTPPYHFVLKSQYQMATSVANPPAVNPLPLAIHDNRTRLAYLDIPFEFPFYGQKFSTLYIGDNGTINFDSLSYPYAYICDGLAYLKGRFCIAGGYSMSGYYYRPEGDQIMAEMREDQVWIQWHIVSHLTGDTLMPAVRLFPSGKIEIYRPPFAGEHPDMVYSGVSAGNNADFHLTSYDESNVHMPHCLTFIPDQPAADFSLSGDGQLTFNPSSDTVAYQLTVKVTDDQRRWSEKSFGVYNGILVTAEVIPSGSDDSTFYLQLNLKNQSSLTLSQPSIVITTQHPMIRIVHGTVNLDDISVNQSVNIQNKIIFVVRSGFSGSEHVSFTASVSSPELYREAYLPVTLSQPRLTLVGSRIEDGHNNRLDPGETADLVVTVANVSDVALHHLHWSLVSASEAVTVSENGLSTEGVILPGHYGERRFTLHALQTTVPGSSHPLTLTLYDTAGYQTDFPITLPVGQSMVLIADAAKKSFTADTLEKYFGLMGISSRRVKSASVDFNAPAIFLLLGSQSNQHNLTVEEGGRFGDYLLQGKNLYVEGFNFWHYALKTRFNKYLMYSTTSSSINRYDSLTGHNGNFMAGNRVKLTLGSAISTYTMSLLGNSKPLLLSDIAQPRNIVYSKDTVYKVIGSIAEIGNMTPVFPLTMRKLVGSYCHFLGIDTSGIQPLFHAGKRFVTTTDTVVFTDDSYTGIETRQWEFPGGTPAVSSDFSPRVNYPVQGSYAVKLTVWKNGISRSITRTNYVNVARSTVIHPLPHDEKGLLVSPNPASDLIKVLVPFTGNDWLTVEWFSPDGRLIESLSMPSAPVLSLSTLRLTPGLYLLRLSGRAASLTTKVTVVR